MATHVELTVGAIGDLRNVRVDADGEHADLALQLALAAVATDSGCACRCTHTLSIDIDRASPRASQERQSSARRTPA